MPDLSGEDFNLPVTSERCNDAKFDKRDYAKVFQCSKWWDQSLRMWVWSDFVSIPPQGPLQAFGREWDELQLLGCWSRLPCTHPCPPAVQREPGSRSDQVLLTPAAGQGVVPPPAEPGTTHTAINTSLNDTDNYSTWNLPSSALPFNCNSADGQKTGHRNLCSAHGRDKKKP